MPRGGLQRSDTRSRKQDCGTESGSSKIKKTWFVPNDAHSQGSDRFIAHVKESTEERSNWREDVLEFRMQARMHHASTDRERH